MTIQYTCPKCGGHRFYIVVENTATVEFKPDEDIEVENVTDEAQWDNNSSAACAEEACTWHGKIEDAGTK